MPAHDLRGLLEAPLEQASPAALDAEDRNWECWDRLIAFERELLRALNGKAPDQFRFNFSSATQLLNQVRDICGLLLHDDDRGIKPVLNAFWCSATAPGRLPVVFRPSISPFPLAVTGVVQRRSLLVATCATLDPNPEASTSLFGLDALPAIETFIVKADWGKLESYMSLSNHWSPSFVQNLRDARQRQHRDDNIAKLRGSNTAFNTSSPDRR